MVEGSHLHREIHSQPAVLERLLSTQRKPARDLVLAISSRAINHVLIAARGTSDNAARFAQYVFGAMNGLLVSLATPSLYTFYHRPPRLRDVLVLGISQSGRSPDIIAVLAEARSQGALTATLTNETDSELAGLGDFVIDLCAGEEQAVAATKTYTAELAAISLLSATIAGDPDMVAALERTPTAVSKALSTEDAARQAAARLQKFSHAAVIGRGFNYATAFELAIKLAELTYSPVQAYSSADFLHGPLAVVERGFPVIVVAAAGALRDDLSGLLRTLDERRAEVVCITDEAGLIEPSGGVIRVPQEVPEWLSPLPLIVPGQLLALHLAHLRGLDVDSPRSIKKVTETR
jgi:glucosamine--fructose-6-phosphate aminotransferase (isomerizing)